jgi:valyl-tRNA synthetase
LLLVAKDRAKAEKLRKFQEKQAKMNTAPAAAKPKKEKVKEVEVIPEYVEETPKGQKK